MNCVLALFENGALPPSLIAKYIGVKASTVTGIVDRLEKKGLVVRLRNRLDRRGIHIQLTEAGRDFVENGPLSTRQYIVDRLKKLPENEGERMVQALRQLAEMLESQRTGLEDTPHSLSNHASNQ
jgi:DNA-binding MarR family transcriptional regulator